MAEVRSIDCDSWYIKRLDGVTFTFQVRYAPVELHADEASNVFTNDPSGPASFDNTKHLRPEVAVVFLALSLPGIAEGLTRKTSGDKVNWSDRNWIKRPDVFMDNCVRPMLFKYRTAVRVYLTERMFNVTPDRIRSERIAANS